jgi:hypothetical protein
MSKVRVTFDYYPDEPDDQDATGMSDHEYEALTQGLVDLGADNITTEVIEEKG